VVGEALRGGRRDKAFIVTKVLPSNASRRRLAAPASGAWRVFRSIGSTCICCTGAAPRRWPKRSRRSSSWCSRAGSPAGASAISMSMTCGSCTSCRWEPLRRDQVYYSPRGAESSSTCCLVALAPRPADGLLPVRRGRILSDDTLAAIGRKHAVGSARVALAWLLAKPGVIAIPKAGTAEHLRENLAAASLELDAEDFEQIDRHWPPPLENRGLPSSESFPTEAAWCSVHAHDDHIGARTVSSTLAVAARAGHLEVHAFLAAVGLFVLGPLGGLAASYMNFSIGFYVSGQVLAGILGSTVTFGYGADGKHGANYIQTIAASVAQMSAMAVVLQAMSGWVCRSRRCGRHCCT